MFGHVLLQQNFCAWPKADDNIAKVRILPAPLKIVVVVAMQGAGLPVCTHTSTDENVSLDRSKFSADNTVQYRAGPHGGGQLGHVRAIVTAEIDGTALGDG